MFGYDKTIKLCIGEYIGCMLLHIFYACIKFDLSVIYEAIVFSVLMIVVSVVFIRFVKQRTVSIVLFYLCMIISTTVLGKLLGTLAFSMFIFLVITCAFTIFMDKLFVIISGSLSILTAVIYILAFKEDILKNVGSITIFCVYIVIYLVALINLYIVVNQGRKYIEGMEEKAREAQQANDSKSLFLANMSHEIRTPMNAICGMIELALKEECSPVLKDYLSGIHRSGKVLITIVNDILDYSKLENGNFELMPVSYSLSNMMQDMINMMQIHLSDKEVTLLYTINPDVPDSLMGDEVRVRQILYNLLSNAVTFTDKGSVEIKINCDKLEDNKIRLKVSVSDTGIGIRKEDIDKIFVSFQQIDTKKSRNREGSGLGLAICKSICEHMQGSISVESTYGVGSTFYFDIIQEISTQKVEHNYFEKITEEKSGKLTVHDSTVLVVDDNAVNLKVAQGLLRTFGLTVQTCKSGRECLDILKENSDFDIIFIDHMMPEIDGIETMKIIRANESEKINKLPLIALTANVMDGVRDMYIAEGFDDFVGKPIDMVWMNSVLRKYIPEQKQS